MHPTSDHDQPNDNAASQHDLQAPDRNTQAMPSHQRQHMANVARAQTEHIYQHNPPNQLRDSASPYQRTHQPTQDWQNYHTAWQQYYQQYYHRYYEQQLHTQRQQQASDKAAQASQTPQLAWQTVTGADAVPEPKTQARQLRDDLLTKVRDRANGLRKSHHFMPLVSAGIVGLVFLFLQFNRLFLAQVEAYVSPGSTVDVSDSVIVDPSANASVGPEPKVIIPKINVNVPFVYDVNSTDDKPVQAALERGVVRYNLPGASSLPGQVGNTVILGHSSNDVFDSGGYKFAFVLINRLEPGDLFYLNYLGKRYVYRVSEKKIINPNEYSVLQQTNGKAMVTLVTCTPAGTALHRLLVFGEQISPDPSAVAAQPAAPAQSTTTPATLPGNSPTFLERIRDFFF